LGNEGKSLGSSALDPSNSEDAECIRAILSDDVSDGDSIDDGTESDEDYL
jgi:hypothetical protein